MAQQPHETIWNLATATVASRTLHVIAELGVADHIDASPVPARSWPLVAVRTPGLSTGP